MCKKKWFYLLFAVVMSAGLAGPSQAYPGRPSSTEVTYHLLYFPARVVSAFSAMVWDVPTAAFQESIKGAIGGTKMVARNLGKEDGVYEMVAGGVTGGPVGVIGGATYGLFHGLIYGAKHGYKGYPSTHADSKTMLFQGKQYVVPYDDN